MRRTLHDIRIDTTIGMGNETLIRLMFIAEDYTARVIVFKRGQLMSEVVKLLGSIKTD